MVPTFIHIDSFHLNKTNGSISSSTKITNIWVYYNSNPIGQFDLPATFPIMASGNGTLQVSPGILVNGLNEQLMAYPFYAIDTFSFTAQPGKIIPHIPQTSYYTGLKFFTFCDGRAVNFVQCGGTSEISKSPNTDSLEYLGEPCAMINLSSPGDSSIDSSASFTIDNGPAFIEFNYKSEIPFYLGLQATVTGVETSAPYYLIGVNPSSAWQKFYLNVGEFNNLYKGTSYILYIKANLNAGQTSGRLLLANVQLVEF